MVELSRANKANAEKVWLCIIVLDLELSVLILGAMIVRLGCIQCSKSRPRECGALDCDLI